MNSTGGACGLACAAVNASICIHSVLVASGSDSFHGAGGCARAAANANFFINLVSHYKLPPHNKSVNAISHIRAIHITVHCIIKNQKIKQFFIVFYRKTYDIFVTKFNFA